MSVRKTARLLIGGALILIIAATALALIRAGALISLYTAILAKVSDATGLDLWASRAVALVLVTLIWLLPWHLLFLPWVGGAKRQVGILITAATLALAGTEFLTRDVYFARSDGRPLRHYILTLDGYKFAATPGTDPVYGIPYSPVTADVARAYMLWKRRGGNIEDPTLPKGRYFDPGTGEPLRWYAVTPDKKIDMFTLPGFHPTYGTKLAPASPDAVAQYQKQEAIRQEEERRRQEKADAEARRLASIIERDEEIRKAREDLRRREEEQTRLAMALSPGRYLFPRPMPQGRVDDLVFTLTEIDIASDRMTAHIAVENVGFDPNAAPSCRTKRFIRFAIALPDGTTRADTATRIKEGALTATADSFYFPSLGRRGAFVMDFPPLSPDTQTFSLLVNDAPIFSAINLRTLRHETF